MSATTKRRKVVAGASRHVRWAREIITYYNTHRGAGSTYHQEHGWLAPPAGPFTSVIVTPYVGSAQAVAARDAQCKVVSLSSDPMRLRGLNGPLLVEHSALTLILSGLLAEMHREKERARRRASRAAEKSGDAR